MEKEFVSEALALIFVVSALIAATSPIVQESAIITYAGLPHVVKASYSMCSQCLLWEGMVSACVSTNVAELKAEDNPAKWMLPVFVKDPHKLVSSESSESSEDEASEWFANEPNQNTYPLATPQWRSTLFVTPFVVGVSVWITGLTVRAQNPTAMFVGRRLFCWLLFIGLAGIVASGLVYISLVESRNIIVPGFPTLKIATPQQFGFGAYGFAVMILTGTLATFAEASA